MRSVSLCGIVVPVGYLQVQQLTILMSPLEKDMSLLDSLNAFIKAVTRQRWFKSKLPSPYSTRI